MRSARTVLSSEKRSEMSPSNRERRTNLGIRSCYILARKTEAFGFRLLVYAVKTID